MAELKEGSKAPAVKLETDAGEPFDLSAYKGHKVVLYFYPKADTPG
jgi:peroxiredoxin Q/BCP